MHCGCPSVDSYHHVILLPSEATWMTAEKNAISMVAMRDSLPSAISSTPILLRFQY